MLNLFMLNTISETATEALEDGQVVLREGNYLYARLFRAFDLEGNSVRAGLLMLGAVLLCILIPYLIGSINPSIIFSRLFYKEDIRTYGSGNAGTTNTLRTYGPKMAILIFCLDLLKAAIGVMIGWAILDKAVGGAIAGLFVILGHTFPVYYKFKGGKGVACCAMVALILSPISTLIILAVFVVIVLLTRFISMGSVICAMLLPFMNSVFYPQHGTITISYFCIMALIVVMHRENIKRLLEGKESKLSFKKTDKHMVGEHDHSNTAEKAIPEKQYSDTDFVKCSCGRLIPISREKCVYCGERNPHFIPKATENKGRKKK